MIDTKPLDELTPLKAFKQEYLNESVAALDGMWLTGFVPLAKHFGFYSNNNLIGYYCVNDEGFVLQFYICTAYRDQTAKLFSSLFEKDTAIGAFVSTAEPLFLTCCLDHFNSFEVNTLMYQLSDSHKRVANEELSILGSPINLKQLDEAVSFAHLAIDAPQEWLNNYFGNLIERQELFGFWNEGELLATGECRVNDLFQTEYADIGMIVAKDQRGKGIATQVLRDLVVIAKSRNLEAICSTEKTNLAAQKAITRAGFIAKHRILKFSKEN